MTDEMEVLKVELEDAASRSALVGLLGSLSQATQQWHFVGVVDGELRYESPTFAAPYSWGHLPLGPTMRPREEWAPGMAQSFDHLVRRMLADGWQPAGRSGGQPWELAFRRGRPAGRWADG